MIRASQPHRSQVLAFASLAYASALGVAVLAVMTKGTSGEGAWLIVAPPLIAAVLAIASARRELVWAAIGACLALGLISIFSIGIFVLQIALCLLVWWISTRRRSGQEVVVLADLLWVNVGFMAFAAPVLGFA